MSGREHRVELETLDLGPVLGSGGEATIYAIGKREALKLYHPGSSIDGKALTRLIAWYETLPAAERSILDASCAWPTTRVDSKGRAVGCLMPRIPPHFIQALNTGLERPREIQYLCQRDQSEALGVEVPSWEDRLALCHHYARVLAVLERNGIVFGDISLRNLLWVLGKRSGVYWIDCDSARRAGTPGVRPAVNTPHWEDPTLSGAPPDHASDRYLLALVIFRILFQDPYGRPGKGDPRLNGKGGLSAELAALLTEALTGPRDKRPKVELLEAELEPRRRRIETGKGTATRPKVKARGAKGRARVPVRVDASTQPPAGSKKRGTIPVRAGALATSSSESQAEGGGAEGSAPTWTDRHQTALIVLAVVIIVLLVCVCAALR